VFYLLSLFPAVMAALVRILQFFSSESLPSGVEIFSNMIMVFYLQFFVLILALFFGTSICSEEVEGKTLTYLTTRPIPKMSIIIGKYAAYGILAVFMTIAGMTISFLILNFENVLDLSLLVLFIKDLGVMILAVAVYTAFLTFIGTWMKKSILFGLVFVFGWENVIQYFPGSTQRFAIVHYLKSLLPAQHSGREFSILLFRLDPTSPGKAIVVLLLLTIVFLALASYVFTKKEYILEN